jgi:ABC-type transporter Mla subunit MlaD
VNRIKIIDKLNTYFQEYQLACDGLKKLLESAVKVDEERKKLLSQVSQLTKNKIDFDQLDSTIDKFIQDSGDWGQNINNLNNNVNDLLTK